MMKCSSLFLSVWILSLSAKLYAQTDASVLFIGNSYTASNNLPALVRDLAASKGYTMNTTAVTPGGYTFQAHSTDANTLNNIGGGLWSYVVLQEQSQRPAFSPAQVALEVYPYARTLDSLIHVSSPCAKTVFFMTWGRKYGDQSNCAFYPPVCTFEGMTGRLRDSYVQMGIDNDTYIAPVGIAFKTSRMRDSLIDLWSGDYSHPSLEGSYLAACVLFASIYKESPLGATYYSTLPQSVAEFLQAIADSTVMDSLAVWNLLNTPPNAAFTGSPSGLDVQFTNLSTHAQTYVWDFGDGNQSGASDPLHSYNSAGTYLVTLMAEQDCQVHFAMDSITVGSNSASVGEIFNQKIRVFPNPSDGNFRISLPFFAGFPLKAEILSLEGREVFHFWIGSQEQSLELNFLNPGMYFLRFSGDPVLPAELIIKR
jgi:hypothetical protein